MLLCTHLTSRNYNTTKQNNEPEEDEAPSAESSAVSIKYNPNVSIFFMDFRDKSQVARKTHAILFTLD